ncbi:hypothetical protein MUN76_09755 [Leucobacter rhizosphaerae]|uniref:Uncharacterized protein n=1 Tax=Leucobacter rhizosphaerae TaxID=2932245 RepID=A0ABY4FSR6_9MICO|nr:hypothetical protein [Leucobacter rhizosphaerae]UOQ59343.1 hypothetical protein MUN76_09755 [Leucobacter rhizosphaerae]
MTDADGKRAAIEPAEALFGRDPVVAADAPRPGPIIGGTVLVLLRAVAAVLWSVALAAEWDSTIESLDLPSGTGDLHIVLWILLGFLGVWTLLLLVLALLLWRGSNLARLLVMVWTTLSITAAAIGYFTLGEEITFRTTLLTLALDILVLLALSSRDARIWARRPRLGRRSRRG